MRGKWLLFSGTVILLAAAAGALSRLRVPKTEVRSTPSAAVSTAGEVSLPGKIQAQHTVTVAASTEGQIAAFDAEVGQEVFQGQMLARIGNEGLQAEQVNATAELDRAQTRVNNLESSMLQSRLDASRATADASRSRSEADRLSKVYDRQQMLLREGATPRLVFEKAEREFRASQDEAATLSDLARQAEDRVATLVQELEVARRQLDSKNEEMERIKAEFAASEVHSPVTGVVVARRGQIGDDVDSTTKDLFEIAVDLSQLKVVVEPKPVDLQRIRPGLPAVVLVTENGNEPLAGLVRDVKGSQVYVEFQNPNPAVKPGLTAQVQIKLT